MPAPRLICTLGPSCDTPEILISLKKAGVDVFRVNMSHADLDELKRYIDIAKSNNIKIGIDTEGAQIRTKITDKKAIYIEKGQRLKIYKRNKNLVNSSALSLYPESVNHLLKETMLIRLDFNGALILLENITNDYFDCRCVSPGLIANNKGVDIINQELDLPDFTEKDLKALKIGHENKIEEIFISFCKSKQAVLRAKSIIPNAYITSKIESKLSINNLPEILQYSDCILVDRGDLTREINIMDIPFAQRGIIKMAMNTCTPCYVATNVLESLIEGSLPTRAELNDIVGTMEMGATGIVLAAETAIGKKPVLCAEIVSELIHRLYMHQNGLLFADLDRNEITDQDMRVWLNRITINHGDNMS
ncbi:pyruvate kinase [Prochlorococcus sp. MIT 1307]|uniref:pyruvate kinase n=1 Tax=Prochlorococcus sp. MIT 1307 TaxID=3096219 RepID=UPI002A747FD6|nr:pyruvate kinase [Prochlorococcus sp. MIT 1307]